uniref:Uncharacterized protein n=1 Tax=Lepeophtheirus salmonis TaxID=72036 RepID=A0A0K2UQ93_LEPSM
MEQVFNLQNDWILAKKVSWVTMESKECKSHSL